MKFPFCWYQIWQKGYIIAHFTSQRTISGYYFTSRSPTYLFTRKYTLIPLYHYHVWVPPSFLYHYIHYLSTQLSSSFFNFCITTHLDDICCISFSNNECRSSSNVVLRHLLVFVRVFHNSFSSYSYSSTKSHLFCTYFLWVLIKYLPELQFISNFIHIFINISSWSPDPSFSEITHAWTSRRHFVFLRTICMTS